MKSTTSIFFPPAGRGPDSEYILWSHNSMILLDKEGQAAINSFKPPSGK